MIEIHTLGLEALGCGVLNQKKILHHSLVDFKSVQRFAYKRLIPLKQKKDSYTREGVAI